MILFILTTNTPASKNIVNDKSISALCIHQQLEFLTALIYIRQNIFIQQLLEKTTHPAARLRYHTQLVICTSITVQDDASLEGNHNFTVAITSTSLDPDAIRIPFSSLLILIQDDERKYFW